MKNYDNHPKRQKMSPAFSADYCLLHPRCPTCGFIGCSAIPANRKNKRYHKSQSRDSIRY